MKNIRPPFLKSLFNTFILIVIFSIPFAMLFDGLVIQDMNDLPNVIFNKYSIILFVMVGFSELERLIKARGNNPESKNGPLTFLIYFIMTVVFFFFL